MKQTTVKSSALHTPQSPAETSTQPLNAIIKQALAKHPKMALTQFAQTEAYVAWEKAQRREGEQGGQPPKPEELTVKECLQYLYDDLRDDANQANALYERAADNPKQSARAKQLYKQANALKSAASKAEMLVHDLHCLDSEAQEAAVQSIPLFMSAYECKCGRRLPRSSIDCQTLAIAVVPHNSDFSERLTMLARELRDCTPVRT